MEGGTRGARRVLEPKHAGIERESEKPKVRKIFPSLFFFSVFLFSFES
jgi:hypothetical protein